MKAATRQQLQSHAITSRAGATVHFRALSCTRCCFLSSSQYRGVSALQLMYSFHDHTCVASFSHSEPGEFASGGDFYFLYICNFKHQLSGPAVSAQTCSFGRRVVAVSQITYYGLHQFFLTERAVYLIVWDATKFEGLNGEDLDKVCLVFFLVVGTSIPDANFLRFPN